MSLENQRAVRSMSGAPRLSDDLRRILFQAKRKEVSFNQILRMMRGRGFPSLLILLSLPFIIPIPIPGLSTPIGLAIMFFGFRIAMGKRPMLPRRLLRRKFSYRMLERVIGKALPIIVRLERLLHPRISWLQRWPPFRAVNGLAVAVSGIALMLPLPIPFTNTIPAIAIILLSAGMMEEDGLFILMGYAVAIATWLYLAVLFWVGRIGFDFLANGLMKIGW